MVSPTSRNPIYRPQITPQTRSRLLPTAQSYIALAIGHEEGECRGKANQYNLRCHFLLNFVPIKGIFFPSPSLLDCVPVKLSSFGRIGSYLFCFTVFPPSGCCAYEALYGFAGGCEGTPISCSCTCACAPLPLSVGYGSCGFLFIVRCEVFWGRREGQAARNEV